MSVSIPDGLVVLTFDDGVKSQRTFAVPILRECGFNATFYITEGLNFLTDKTRYLTWEEVRELHDLGFEIGNHTRQHKSVANQSREELLSDIRYIDRQCNHYGIPTPTTFCYPGYTNTSEAVDVLKERGFTYARRGTVPEYPYDREGGRGPAYNPEQHDPLLIPTTGASGPHWNFDDFLWSLDQAQNGCATVLTFHGVPDLDHPWVHTEPAFFERCMQHLTDNGHRVIALHDLTNYIAMES